MCTCTVVDLCAGCDETKYVCDAATGECSRDCSAFQIDEFLDDCSVRYGVNVDGIAALDTEISGIDTPI